MFKVLHSSAGAGKTHALVKHYLGHCLGSSDYGSYRHVLALTFTNKAAAEMKERVIRYLEGLAQGGPFHGPLADVADDLQRKTGIDTTELAHRANVVLGHMLHHWSDVAISTIDAFTRRVVKPFARDLRLDQDLRMTTEQDHYREAAVNTLIDRAGHDQRITELLTETCLQLLHEERGWEPTKPLLDLSRELLNERSIAPLQRSRDRSLEELTALKERLNVETARFRRRVNGIGREAMDLFTALDIPVSDVAFGGNPIKYFQRLLEFKDHWEEPGKQLVKTIETGKWHSGKASAASIHALASISGQLTDLFHAAERLRAEGLRHYVIQWAVVRELLPAFALHELDSTLEELKHQDGVVFFSDLTRRVAEVVKNEPVPFIYERLGERYKHFLIDEFQDTSLLQWNALLPLLENALSTDGSVLLVGDAKQAIYRWRNGEVRLFIELPRLFGMDPEDDAQLQRQDTLVRTYHKGDSLDHNRRSAQRIIAFNNALFGALAQRLPEGLRKVYDGHDQHTARPELGTVRMIVDEEGLRGAELVAATCQFALDRLQTALAQGYRTGDVAVLVRSKRIGRSVAEFLQAHGHGVISPDGLQLAADPAVQLLVECLRFLVYGDETTAARILQWQAMLNAPPGGDAERAINWSLPMEDGRSHAANTVMDLLAEQRKTSLRTTLLSLVEELARGFGMKPAEDAALLTFMDEVHAWSMGHAQDISGFLEHWDRSGGERSHASADGADAVQVMTVHKSKGLQFPVVIVPDARMTSGKQHSELFWVDPGAAVPELETALVRESKVLRSIELVELEEEQGLRDLDALNLLYVAFTRAEDQLHAFVPKATDPIAAGLADFVSAHPELANTANDLPLAPRHTPARTTIALRDVATPDHGVPWAIRPTEEEEEQASRQERTYGTLVHALLAAIRSAEELPAALAHAVASGELSSDHAKDLDFKLTPMIGSGALAKWFGAQGDVRAEATIILGDGASLRPDRVVMDDDGTHVLEIKTGKASDTHAEQLGRYIRTLREMGHTKVQGTIWYVHTGTLQAVA